MRSDFYQLMSDLMQIERFDLKSNKDLEPIKSLQTMVDPFVPVIPWCPPEPPEPSRWQPLQG